MIRLKDVRKVYPTRFGENVVLDGISFDLAKGEKLGVLGRNGAGKSTMVRLISGAELPTSGTVERGMSVSWPLAFGGAFQPTLTGVDNVRFISRIYDQDFEKNIEFVEDFAELGPYLREEVRTYSSGMRARLAFAISMIIEFDCFLIDEVGAVGDARFHERCNRELFQKRGDRAMVIISHDAGYLRDHCTRFALLHDARLVEYDDFEEAYSDFRGKIGLEAIAQTVERDLPGSRKRLIETTHISAVRDDAFRVLVQDADWKREAGNWLEAEADYAAALQLYPYQRSYWAQKAHCAKRAEAFDRAEAAYRTAFALGEPLNNIQVHLESALRNKGETLEEFPLFAYVSGEASDQPPGIPDVQLLARAAWKTEDVSDHETVALLRNNATCDALLATMIKDRRFRSVQRQWLDSVTNHTRVNTSAGKGTAPSDDVLIWARNLACIACPEREGRSPEAVAQKIYGLENAWAVVMEADGFSGWTETEAALAACRERV